MDKATIGFLALVGIVHLILIVVPLMTTLRASISGRSKLAWSAFLVFLPFVGVGVFHFRFGSSVFKGKLWEPTAHELGVRKPHDTTKDRHGQ